MKFRLKIALIAALAIGLAVPAMAETTFTGSLTIMPMVAYDKVDGAFQKDEEPNKPVDQRLRFTMNNKVNDYVNVVWQTEIDTPWGYANSTTPNAGKYGTSGFGASLGTDGVNLETKHLYLDAKLPEYAEFSTRLGLQNLKDNTLGGLYFWYDVAGAKFNYTKDALSVNFGMMKPTSADELWMVMAGYKLSETATANFDLFNYNYETGEDYRTIGFGLKEKVENVGVDLGLGIQSGDEAAGLLVTLGVKTKINEIPVSARALYVADDNEGKQWKFVTDSPLAGEGLNFFANSPYANFSTGKYAFTDAAAKGLGLNCAVVNTVIPVQNWQVKAAVGYFQAGKDGSNETLGTELGITATNKLAENVELSVVGGYAFLGEFYNGTTTDGENPDNPYIVGVRLVSSF